MSEQAIPCPACGADNPARNRFCIECGGALEAACPACGAVNPARARFCGECGGAMHADAPAPGPTAPRPEEYTPRHLAERIVGSRAAMEGERKQVTVLFADVVGSTALIGELDAEAAVARLGPAVAAMMGAVHRHEGMVNRVQGDGVMALFGAPIAHEDHAARACLAALEIRDAVATLGDEALGVRVGLNSGEVVVRAIHNDLTVDYEADGATVHLGARMEQLAEPGTVRATRSTFRLAEGYVEGRTLGALPVKGMEAPVEQVELTRAVAAASRWEIRARRGLTRFVGRASELGVLEDTLALAGEGHGQVVAIAGEPGMGKSRLVHEFLSARVPETWTVRVTAASSYGTDTPYLPLRTLLRSVVGAAPGEPAEEVAEKVDGFVESLGAELAVTRSALRALADVPAADPQWDELEPSQRRRRIIDAFRALALRRAERSPLALVFEDLHWVDGETQAALDALVESIPGARLLLLVSYRPEYEDRWAGRGWHRRIQLSGLGASSADVLAGVLLGDDASVAPLRPVLVERTEGRPLFVEETVRALAEEGRLEGTPGAYRLAGAIDAIRIPESVQAVLAARMDRLEPETKRVLQTAAVIGRVVPLPLLQAVSGLAQDELAGHMERLQAGEFLFERQVFPEPEYAFKHALTEGVAYEGLLRARRTELHAAVLDATESLYAAGIEEHLESLARHAFAGERWASAVHYLRRAGAKATAQSAYPEAQRHLEQALAALARLPDGPDRARAGIEVRLELRPALGATGQYPAILTRLTESEELARSCGDQERLTRIRADKIHVLYQLGRVVEAIEEGRRARDAAEASGDRGTLIQATFNLGQAHFWRGEYRQALATIEPFAEELAGPMRHQRLGTTGTSSCLWLGNLCGTHAMLGQFPEALRWGSVAREIAAETTRPFDLAMAASWYGFALLVKGEAIAASEVLRETFRVASEAELTFSRAWIGAWLGSSLALLDRLEEAEKVTAEAVSIGDRLGLVTSTVWARTCLAEIRLARGEAEAVIPEIRRILEATRAMEFRCPEPLALRVLAGALTARDGIESAEAEEALRTCITVCQQQETAPQLAHARLSLGKLLASRGLEREAREELTQALTLYRSMGMQHWIPETQAALASASQEG